MKRFTLSQLNETDQADLIMETGVLIGKRKDDYYNVLLFQIDAFYAEIFYHSHFNVIIKVETFSNTSKLEPYLAKISIKDLLDF